MNAGINAKQLRDLIVTPTLMTMGAQYASYHAVELLMGTAAQESLMGHYLHQLDGGPAVGIYQMEPETYLDILNHFVTYHDDVLWMLKRFGYAHDEGDEVIRFEPAQRMVWDLQMATIFARLHYYRRPEPLPTTKDGYAAYWKEHYNTHLGAGTNIEYLHNYARFC